MSDLSLSLAAQGIFLTSSTTDKKSGGSARTSARDRLAALEKRNYCVRLAASSDLAALEALEAACWPAHLRADGARLAARLAAGATYVATVDGALAAVLYTQRIASAASLTTFATQEDACVRASDGATLQLLAVAAHPSRHPLRLGVALRDFALEQAELDGVTREVVAMTRCSHYARRNAADGADAAAYAAYVARADDPGLRFHTSAGAAVVGAVDGYRPEDGDNCGAAVLVRYTVGAAEVAAAAEPAPVAPRVSEASFEAALTRAVGAALPPLTASSHIPYMDLGLDSFDLLELHTVIEAELVPQRAPLPRALLFDHPTPAATLAFLNAAAEPTADEAPPPTVPPTEGDDDDDDNGEAIAIVGMSCRLPGGCDSPAALWEMLCDGRDAVGAPPPGWGPACAGGYLSESQQPEAFDPEWFGIGEAEAAAMDPHQRLLLELACEALVTAGETPTSARDGAPPHGCADGGGGADSTGVYVGLSNGEWPATATGGGGRAGGRVRRDGHVGCDRSEPHHLRARAQGAFARGGHCVLVVAFRTAPRVPRAAGPRDSPRDRRRRRPDRLSAGDRCARRRGDARCRQPLQALRRQGGRVCARRGRGVCGAQARR